MTLEELQVIIEAQTSQFKKELKTVQNEVKSMTSSVNKQVASIKNIFSRLGKFLVALGLGKIFVNSIKSAMNAIESESLVGTVFGSMTDDIREWSNELQNSLGLNGYAVRENAAVLYNMTRSMGLAKESALGLSKDLTLLAEDMASFYNLNSDEAFNKIRAGLTGETEPLKALGILVDTNTLKQYGYRDSLSNSEKVMIRYQAILAQTGAANGDLARTLDSPANQVRILKNNLQLLGIELGRAFMPIVQVVIPILNSLVRAITRVVSAIATFTSTLFGKSSGKSSGLGSIAGSMSDATSGAIDFGDAIGSAGDSAKKTAKEVNRLMGGFDEINSLSKNSDATGGGASGSGGMGGGLGDLGALDLGLDEEPDTSGVSKAALKVKAILNDLANFIKQNKEIILSVVGGLMAGLISYFAGPKILKAVKMFILNIKAIPTGIGVAFLNIASFITSPVTLISLAIGSVVAALIYIWQTSDGFRKACIEAWEGIKEIVSTVWKSFLKPIFDAIVTSLLMIWENGLKPLVKAFVECVEQVAMLLLNLWNNVLQPVFNWIFEILGPPFAAIISVVLYIISGAITTIMVIISGVLDFFTWCIEMVNKLFTLDWKAIWEECKKIVSDIWNNITEFFRNTWDKIKSFGDTAWSGIKDIWNSASNWFNTKVIEPIRSFFSNMWSSIKTTTSNAWDWILNLFSKGGKIFSGITGSIAEVFKTIVNSIISGINTVIAIPFNSINGILNKIRGISILGITPFSGFWGYNPLPVPRIPKLARGGIVDSATMFIAGEAGKEVVMPLENNTGWITQLAEKVAARMPQGNYDNSYNGDLILMIDGSVIGKVALKQLRKMQRQGGITLMPT